MVESSFLTLLLLRFASTATLNPNPTQAEAPCVSALSMAQVDPSAISSVLLIGGCCRTPALQKLARKMFRRAGDGAILTPEQAEEFVVMGAALEARRMVYE